MEPGNIIKPGDTAEQKAQTQQPPVQAPVPPESEKASEQTPTEPQAGWSYNDDSGLDAQPGAAMPEISWTASEYVSHEKGTGWFMGLAAITGLATVAVYFLTEDWLTVVIILIVAVVFGAFALRQPHVLSYRIDSQGVTIAEKHYPYTSFRSFALQEEGAIDSILLIPMKRFMPGLSIYFPPEQGEQVVGTLGNYLPHEERQPDVVDRLMRKVRF